MCPETTRRCDYNIPYRPLFLTSGYSTHIATESTTPPTKRHNGVQRHHVTDGHHSNSDRARTPLPVIFRNVNSVSIVVEGNVDEQRGVTECSTRPALLRQSPSEVGERVWRGRQRTVIYDAIQREFNPASEASVRTGPQPPSRSDDAINGVAENVFGTTGQSALLSTCSFYIPLPAPIHCFVT